MKIMKKLLVISLASLMLLSASACGKAAGWSDTYAKVLDAAMTEFPEYKNTCVYSLYDMDKDGTPELMVKTGTCEADFQYKLYSFSSGEAKLLETLSGSHSALAGLQNAHVLLLINGAQGYETVTACTYSDGTISTVEVFSGYVDEYHPFEYLPYFELDDPSGLGWTGDQTGNNDTVFSSIKAR